MKKIINGVLGYLLSVIIGELLISWFKKLKNRRKLRDEDHEQLERMTVMNEELRDTFEDLGLL